MRGTNFDLQSPNIAVDGGQSTYFYMQMQFASTSLLPSCAKARTHALTLRKAEGKTP